MWIFHSQYEPVQCALSAARFNQNTEASWPFIWWTNLESSEGSVTLSDSHIYVKYWFQCTSATEAPQNGLNKLCLLSTYQNKDVAKAATSAFSRPFVVLILAAGWVCILWRSIDHVSVDEKRLVVKTLNENSGSVEPLKRIPPFQGPVVKGLHNFVTTSVMRFFHIFELSEDFLQ